MHRLSIVAIDETLQSYVVVVFTLHAGFRILTMAYNVIEVVCIVVAFVLFFCESKAELTCSLQAQSVINDEDLGLKEMKYDIGHGEHSFMAYVEPDVETMYNGNPPASTLVVPKFDGFSTKFINMSHKIVKLHWVPNHEGRESSPMNVILPFHEAGTASFPGHRFVLTDPDDTRIVYQRLVIGQYPNNLQIYDPYLVENDPEATERNLALSLTLDERRQYDELKNTVEFNRRYFEFTGRSYLANYLRDRPKHFIWPAQYFGQQHWIVSRESHFISMPPDALLGPLEGETLGRVLQEADPRVLQEYRTPLEEQSTLNLTLKVLSVAPRVFEIKYFLSQVEVDHILKLAAGVELSRSTVGNAQKDLGGGNATNPESKAEVKVDTRTSFNSWLQRSQSPIIDAIYRRAADVMRFDEALFRERTQHEVPGFASKKTIAEQLQLVHYDPGQEYTAHHDFGYRDLKRNQRARFATMLFYLNDEGLEGGETSFPRWKNAETFHPLKVKPEAGKAILFYSQLPDGNFDDFSQHAAEKPRAGEKWLINMWTWDPLMDD